MEKLSKASPKFKMYIKDGVPIRDDETKKRFVEYCKTKKEGFYYTTLKKEGNKRSLSQNAYYWAVVIKILSEHTGYETDEMHEYLKLRFNSHRIYSAKLNKDLPPVPKTTTELETIEFKEYCDRIQRWAAQGGDDDNSNDLFALSFDRVEIPDPGQYDFSS